MQKYLDYVTDIEGNVIPGATVRVKLAGTATDATIYSDNGTTPKANPFAVETTDGSYYFYAANGRYDLITAATGFVFDADDTADLTLFDLTGVGPLAIGGAIDPDVALFVKGAFQGSGPTYGLIVRHTLQGNPNHDIAGMIIDPIITEAASGVHNEIIGCVDEPTIINGGATANEVGARMIAPLVCPAGTGIGYGLKLWASTGAGSNYPLWIASGTSRFDTPIRFPLDVGVLSKDVAGTGDVPLIDGVNIGGVTAVRIGRLGHEIVWGRALVALGGGAAPTLGTIGGSGPASAAQNTWLQVRDSAGNPAWLPVWK